jgi:hypothetical protein
LKGRFSFFDLFVWHFPQQFFVCRWITLQQIMVSCYLNRDTNEGASTTQSNVKWSNCAVRGEWANRREDDCACRYAVWCVSGFEAKSCAAEVLSRAVMEFVLMRGNVNVECWYLFCLLWKA